MSENPVSKNPASENSASENPAPEGPGGQYDPARAGSAPEVPAAPQRPKKRRFAGTVDQISGSLTFYKTFAFITGIMLLILVAKMIMDYGFGYELYAGGTTADGAANTLGFHPKDSVVDGTGISYWVAVVHGWIYVIYVIAGFRLWYLMSWKIGRLIVIVLGGVVPFLSFIVERKIAGEVRREIDANPDAVRRY